MHGHITLLAKALTDTLLDLAGAVVGFTQRHIPIHAYVYIYRYLIADTPCAQLVRVFHTVD